MYARNILVALEQIGTSQVHIAVYHNLPPGGALRALNELLRESSRNHTFHLYETHQIAERRYESGLTCALEEHCERTFRYELPQARLRSLRLGPLYRVRRLHQYEALEGRIAADIAARGYDIAFVNPCMYRGTPSILETLRGTVVYYMQEPRRKTFDYQDKSGGLTDIHGALYRSSEAILRRHDRDAARAPGVYVLCNSFHSAERILGAYGVAPHVSYLGVDDSAFRPRPPSVTPRRGRTTVKIALAVGRLDPAKQFDMLIDAASLIPREERPRVIIASENEDGSSYRTFLERRASALEVDLELRSRISDGALVSLYQEATVTVCTAMLEPFGLTVLESISCGTPVVAIRQGGFRETAVDARVAVLTEPTPSGVASGIQRVLSNADEYGPDVLHMWIRANRWTWRDSADRLDRHFTEAVTQTRDRRPTTP